MLFLSSYKYAMHAGLFVLIAVLIVGCANQTSFIFPIPTQNAEKKVEKHFVGMWEFIPVENNSRIKFDVKFDINTMTYYMSSNVGDFQVVLTKINDFYLASFGIDLRKLKKHLLGFTDEELAYILPQYTIIKIVKINSQCAKIYAVQQIAPLSHKRIVISDMSSEDYTKLIRDKSSLFKYIEVGEMHKK